MSDWNVEQINQLGRVVTGKTPPKTRADYYEGDELFVSPKDFEWNGGYVEKTQTTISRKALEGFKNQVLPENAVLFTSLSFGFGKMAIASRPLLTNQQINSVIANDEHHFRFIYYLLRAYTPIIFSYNSGIDTPIVPKSVFEKVQVRCPELKLQRKIAAILTAYDDLIETNKRRIALLEKMAEELYREWFVRMRFPGYKETKFSQGIPKDWKPIKIGERVSTQYGFTESANENPADPQFLRITDIVPPQINWARVPHCPISEADEEKYLLREGDIVVARTGATVGYAKRINKIDWRAVFASYLVRLTPKNPVDSIYFGMAVESRAFKDFIQGFVTGAAQPQANAKTMSLFPLYYPGENLLREFNQIIQPLFDQKDQLLLQGQTLTQTRDLLLPRLISGKLSVEDLKIQLPPSMREQDEKTAEAHS